MHFTPQPPHLALPASTAGEALYYIHIPREPRPVHHPIEFLSVQDSLADETLVREMWDLVATQFKTRSKFLTIWPNVRHLAVLRRGAGLGGFLLVSAPLNWQIDYVTVRPELRHQGIAAALVGETVNQALERGVPYIMLTSKPSLRPLYEGQCGFQVVARNLSNAEPALAVG